MPEERLSLLEAKLQEKSKAIERLEEKLAELQELLVGKGMWDEEEDHPVVGFYPAAEDEAMWNYILISHEDESRGVHNPGYVRALLDASLAALGGGE